MVYTWCGDITRFGYRSRSVTGNSVHGGFALDRCLVSDVYFHNLNTDSRP